MCELKFDELEFVFEVKRFDIHLYFMNIDREVYLML